MNKMKEDLLKIINHYGINLQQRKLVEEIFELQEAITVYEYDVSNFLGIATKDHIAEEIADVMVLLNQFKAYYEIPNETILTFMRGKVNRQLERIKESD